MINRSLTAFASILLIGLFDLAGTGRAAQKGTDRARFLVARREMPDPLFRESVILMLPSMNPDVVVGLIVNKPTRITLGRVFSNDSTLKNQSDAAYFGGPVDIQAPSALFLSSKPSPGAVQIVGDLYISYDSDFIKGMLQKQGEVRDVHIFLGRSQWTPEQLRAEMQRGAWYSEREEHSLIFNPKPENIWPDLIGRAEPGTLARLHTSDPQPKVARTSRDMDHGSQIIAFEPFSTGCAANTNVRTAFFSHGCFSYP